MIQVNYLDAILAMDFTQLRSNHGKATDEILLTFISNINGFFEQINAANKPTEADIYQVNLILEQILAKINQVEYDYFLRKYTNDELDFTPEALQKMARATQVKRPADIPTRMQYWAATEEFGGCIRNPAAHRKAVKFIQEWFNDSVVVHGTFFVHPKPRLETPQVPVENLPFL